MELDFRWPCCLSWHDYAHDHSKEAQGTAEDLNHQDLYKECWILGIRQCTTASDYSDAYPEDSKFDHLEPWIMIHVKIKCEFYHLPANKISKADNKTWGKDCITSSHRLWIMHSGCWHTFKLCLEDDCHDYTINCNGLTEDDTGKRDACVKS